MDNYPDDIRCYDHDPRSPFYNNKAEQAKEKHVDSLADSNPDLYKQMARLGLEMLVEADAWADEDGPHMGWDHSINGNMLYEEDFAEVAKRLARIDKEHPCLAEQIEEALEI